MGFCLVAPEAVALDTRKAERVSCFWEVRSELEGNGFDGVWKEPNVDTLCKDVALGPRERDAEIEDGAKKGPGPRNGVNSFEFEFKKGGGYGEGFERIGWLVQVDLEFSGNSEEYKPEEKTFMGLTEEGKCDHDELELETDAEESEKGLGSREFCPK